MGHSSNSPHTNKKPHATGEGSGEERIYHVLEPRGDKEEDYQEVDERRAEERIYQEPPPGNGNKESLENEENADYQEIEENDGQRIYHVLTRENAPKES